MNIIEKLKELGYSTVPEEFYTKVQEWKSWYEGDVKGFHRYRVRNGARDGALQAVHPQHGKENPGGLGEPTYE